jgi:hypothetical protein
MIARAFATLRDIWAAIRTPSRPDEAAYDRLVISLAHAVLGAALAALVPPLAVAGAVGRALLPTLYWLLKERGDLRRGGGLKDGLWDTAAVALGLAYGAPWWPVAALLLALAAALDRHLPGGAADP